MATHDYVIANGTGSAVRSDLNNALAAIVSNNSSSSEPATKYAYQWWADTTTGQLKLRNSANNGWVTIFELDGTMLMEDGTVSAPGLAFASDLNTGFYKPNADQIGCVSNGQERVRIGASEVVFNEPSNDVDFRVESNGNTHMLFVDGGNDKVTIGTSSAATNSQLTIGATSPNLTLQASTSSSSIINLGDTDAYNIGRIKYDNSNNSLQFDANNSQRMIIDSSGHVGIGGNGTGNGLGVFLRRSSPTTSNFYEASDGTKTMITGVDSSNDFVKIGSLSNHSVGFVTNNTERMRIDSSGRVGIKTSANGSLYSGGDDLVLGDGGASNQGMTIYTGTSQQGIIAFADGTSGAAQQYAGYLIYDHSADGMLFATGGSETLRIDSSGRLMTGTTTPGNGGADDLTLATTGNTGITIRSGTSSQGAIYFSDGTSGDAEYDGFITYQQGSTSTTDYMSFGTDANERMRIDSAGIISTYRYNKWLRSDGTTDCGFIGRGDQVISGGSTGDFGISTGGGDLIFGSGGTTERMRIDNSGNVLIGTTSVGGSGGISLRSNGHFIAPVCYSVGLSASPRDAFIDSNGELGYVPSIRKAKTNIQVQNNVDWLYQLEPVTFNYKAKDRETGEYTGTAEAELEYGLIAEDVEAACPDLCFYDQTDNGPELRGVSYKKLITPMLKALQDARAEIETLKTKVAALEAG